MMYSIGKFAKEIGVSVCTLRDWHKSGELVPAKVTRGGTRYYTENQLASYTGSVKESECKTITVYARVSNVGQKDDLQNQITFLREYCNARGYIVNVVTDIVGTS